ncbi:hypothetical protein Aperf_G00000008705 [Anoplocephala perfoliata]
MAFQNEVSLFDAERNTIPVKYFNKLRLKGKFTDLTIISKENESIRAHRLVICAQFPSIENKLDGDESGRIEWKRFSSDIIDSIVEFAYTGRIRINLLNVLRVYLLSQNLRCARLITWCVDFMKSRIEDLNLNEIWSVANVTANEELKGICVRSIARNFAVHCRNKCFFTHIELNGLKTLLSDNKILTADVKDKLFAISSWIAVPDSPTERAKREAEFENLLEGVDLSGLPKSFFIDLAMGHTDVVLSDACRRSLLVKCKESEERREIATSATSQVQQPSRKISAQAPATKSQFSNTEILYAYGDDSISYSAFLKTVPGVQEVRRCQFVVPRRDNVEVLALNDDIFIIGGWTETCVSISQVDKVDARNGSITSVQPMSRPRSGASAVVSEQSIIVFGGFDSISNITLSSCERYDPFSDRWTSVGHMSIARFGSGAAHIPGVGELVIGGYSRPNCDEALNVAELLSSVDGSWTTISPMLHSRGFPKATYFERSVIVAGDFNNHLHTIERLILTENLNSQWSMVCTGFPVPSNLTSVCVFRGEFLASFEDAEVYEVKDLLNECRWELICEVEGISWIKLIGVNS